VKSFGSATKDVTSNNPTGTKTPGFDRISYQKKVRQWFLNPQKFCQEIEKEQLKHPDKCLLHLSSSHPTESCHVKLECDKIRTAKTTTTTSGNSASTLTTTRSPQGQLRHVTEEEFTDAVVFEHNADDADFSANDSNEDGLLYFSRLTNHFLCLGRTSVTQSPSPHHRMRFPVIADSGANFHMFREKEFF